MSNDFLRLTINKPRPLWTGLPALAERLGIKAKDAGHIEIAITLDDGRRYDVLEIFNALLDRLDEVEGRKMRNE